MTRSRGERTTTCLAFIFRVHFRPPIHNASVSFSIPSHTIASTFPVFGNARNPLNG